MSTPPHAAPDGAALTLSRVSTMTRRFRVWRLIPSVVLGSMLLAATGCGSTLPSGAVPVPDLHPVSGRVTVAGKPVEGVRVRFVGKSALPNAGGRVLQVDSFTTSDGSFQVNA